MLFTKEEYRQRLGGQNNPMGEYILKETDYYFGYNEGDYGIHGFYNWDVIAAVYLVHPELFDDQKGTYCLSEEDLKTGFLRWAEDGQTNLNLPEIGEEAPFKNNIYETWLRVPVKGVCK